MSAHDGTAGEAPDPTVDVEQVHADQHAPSALQEYIEEAKLAAEERAFLLLHCMIDAALFLGVAAVDFVVIFVMNHYFPDEKEQVWARILQWGLVVTTLVPTLSMLLRDTLVVLWRTWGADLKRLRERGSGGRERS